MSRPDPYRSLLDDMQAKRRKQEDMATKWSAAGCFLVGLGSGDKFTFDIGLGSAERIVAANVR
jgi:hypothetical protein